jgi:hypothetical protein
MPETPASPARPPFQSLWIGSRLGTLERLALASWLAHGHPVHLYVYGDVEGVPGGVELRDANAVIPEREIFAHTARALRGRGSYAGFSNWFRYELLDARGGWWLDTDVICLRPFEFSDAYCFGWQDARRINNAVLRAAAGSPLARTLAAVAREPHRGLPWQSRATRLARDALQRVRRRHRGDLEFGQTGPEMLSAAVAHLGLRAHAQPVARFYPIGWQEWELPFGGHPSARERIRDSHAVHLWNDMLRRKGVDKDAVFHADSLIEEWKSLWL